MRQICYVCDKPIDGEPVPVGNETYRHQRCEPGSKRWLAAQEAKPKKERSALYKYFKRGKDEMRPLF